MKRPAPTKKKTNKKRPTSKLKLAPIRWKRGDDVVLQGMKNEKCNGLKAKLMKSGTQGKFTVKLEDGKNIHDVSHKFFRKYSAEASKHPKKYTARLGQKRKGSEKQLRSDQKKEKKQQKRERREAREPYYQSIEVLNKLWSLPVPKDERNVELEKVMLHCKGTFSQLVDKHDASRGIQRLIKYGSPEQRTRIFGELKGKILKFAKGRYAHHVVLKLLMYGDDKLKNLIKLELANKNSKLLLHALGAQVIDYIYADSNKQEQEKIMQEFYGPAFYLYNTVSVSENQDLDTILASGDAQLKLKVKKAMFAYLTRAINKEQLMFRPLHGLLKRYIQQCTWKEKNFIITELVPFSLALFHSQEGAWCVMESLAWGTAGHRKKVIKSLKDNIINLCFEKYSCLIIIRALDVVDDTKLLKNIILTNLISSLPLQLKEICAGEGYAEYLQPFFHILAPRTTRYFTTEKIDHLVPPKRNVSEDPSNPIMQSTSKKPAEDRRRELCDFAIPKILLIIKDMVEELIRHQQGSWFLYEVIRVTTSSGVLENQEVKENYNDILENISQLCQEDDLEKNIMQDLHAHWVLKKMLITCKKSSFAKLLFQSLTEKIFKKDENSGSGLIIFMNINRGAFILTALIKGAEKELKKKIIAHFNKFSELWQNLSTEAIQPGTEALRKCILEPIDP